MIAETIIIAIGGTLTAITVSSLWFAKWLINAERTDAKEAEAADKAEKEAKKKAAKEAEAADKAEKEAKKKAAAEAERAIKEATPEFIEAKKKADEERLAKAELEHKAKLERAKKNTAEAQKFRPFNNSVCPKCGIEFNYEANGIAFEYCSCDEAIAGHYHRICKVSDNGQGKIRRGCMARWIMLAKDAKVDAA